ncbi:hypothetical protein CEXT_761091 [Caerostris extrusa]|uniref:Uncharacterized protein n=1 Tax=Caerostris extrusa TaxID=172846 RepID=A0AAV4QBH4_CAEEX|nr:hypothetical protein CEXT_761091 [Caerostris extrusa]
MHEHCSSQKKSNRQSGNGRWRCGNRLLYLTGDRAKFKDSKLWNALYNLRFARVKRALAACYVPRSDPQPAIGPPAKAALNHS